MSDIYFQVPPTSGKVVLVTTQGELDIELWCNEAPRACRNFIQLCLEEYYDDTIFHRLVPGFMIQGGDPSGTGKGGESIYGKTFLDEFHQRLKFTHRGMVAMANSGPNSNGSQFFITFDACSWLDKKHTIFGRVVGDTVYNLMAMQKYDVDKNDRPMNPPKILSTKVLINPFDDIIVRNETRKKKAEEERKQKLQEEAKNKKPTTSGKRKAKNTNLLSFADDDEAEDIATKKPEEQDLKMVSSHDVLQDSKLSKQPVITQEELRKKAQEKEEAERKKTNLKSKITEATNQSSKIDIEYDDDDDKKLSFDEEKRRSLRRKKILIAKDNPHAVDVHLADDPENLDLLGLTTYKNKKTGKLEFHWEAPKDSDSSNSSSSSEESEEENVVDEEAKRIRQKQKEEFNNLRVEILKFKKDNLGTINAERTQTQKEEGKIKSNVELQREKYMKDKKTRRHEDEVLDKLNAFRKKLNNVQGKADESNWMSNKLKFHIDSARAYSHFENKEKAGGFSLEQDKELLEFRPKTGEDEQEQKVRVDVISVDDLLKMTE